MRVVGGQAARVDAPPVSRSESEHTGDAETLRWISRAAEATQRERIRRGERLRAVLQARAASAAIAEPIDDADDLLRRIERGDTLGPVPLLGDMYRRAWLEEHELAVLLENAVTSHPAWSWLFQIRGIGPRLASRLLNRLDIQKARSPASFWAYCGLSTVQARQLMCCDCLRVLTFPANGNAPREHESVHGRPCRGLLSAVDGDALRMAQPRPRRHERRAYDATAKTICYLIGLSFARQGGPYKEYYGATYRRYAASHPAWQKKHLAMASMRATVKLFLKHLWIVWTDETREEGASTTQTSSLDAQGPGPWDMVSPPSVEKLRASKVRNHPTRSQTNAIRPRRNRTGRRVVIL